MRDKLKIHCPILPLHFPFFWTRNTQFKHYGVTSNHSLDMFIFYLWNIQLLLDAYTARRLACKLLRDYWTFHPIKKLKEFSLRFIRLSLRDCASFKFWLDGVTLVYSCAILHRLFSL